MKPIPHPGTIPQVILQNANSAATSRSGFPTFATDILYGRAGGQSKRTDQASAYRTEIAGAAA